MSVEDLRIEQGITPNKPDRKLKFQRNSAAPPTRVFVDNIVNSIKRDAELRHDLYNNMERDVKLPSIYKKNLKKLHKNLSSNFVRTAKVTPNKQSERSTERITISNSQHGNIHA